MEKPIYDHMRYGKYTKSFILPPKVTLLENFAEEVKEIAIAKITELQSRFQEIRKDYEEKEGESVYKGIDVAQDISYLVAKFSYEKEKYYIWKWIEYWKKLSGFVKKNASTELNIELAKDFPIEDLYEGNLRKSGSRLLGLCPFHEEKSPSFYIFDDNHFYCFGCEEHGSSIDFLMKVKNLDFVAAVKELQR